MLAKGIFDVTALVLAFWGSGSFREKTILLVIDVGVIALIRGVTELLLAFKLRPRGGRWRSRNAGSWSGLLVGARRTVTG